MVATNFALGPWFLAKATVGANGLLFREGFGTFLVRVYRNWGLFEGAIGGGDKCWAIFIGFGFACVCRGGRLCPGQGVVLLWGRFGIFGFGLFGIRGQYHGPYIRL